MGLRAKFNLVVVPVVAVVVGLMVWSDYRHEAAAVMAAHALHSVPAGTAAGGPIDSSTLPETVAAESLRRHAFYGVLLLGLAVAAVNAALHIFIFRPLSRLRSRLSRLEHGYWRDSTGPVSGDELGQFQASFDGLGREIAAMVGQAVNAERLGAIARVSREVGGLLESELRRVAEAAIALATVRDPEIQEAGRSIARSTATLLGAVRNLDHVFPPELRGPRPAGSSSSTSVAARTGAH